MLAVDGGREPADHPARRPRRGRQEHDRLRDRRRDRRRRRRARVPARRAARRRPRPARPRYLSENADRVRPSCSRTATRTMWAGCRTCSARCRSGRSGAPSSPWRSSSRSSTSTACCAPRSCTRPTPRATPSRSAPFRVEWVRMAHSIPDTAAIVLETSAGRVVHTGDYKIDHTPVDGIRTDVGRLADIGNRGVDLLVGDSTNAERPGVTRSERVVGEAFRQLIPVRDGPHLRLLVRVERAPHAAGDRRRGGGGPEGLRHRPLDAQDAEHLAQPRLHRHPGRHAAEAAGARRVPARQDARALLGQPGRAALGAHADRLQRPPVDRASSAATR